MAPFPSQMKTFPLKSSMGDINVVATLRSSNVTKTLWADYEFLKILSVRTADEMSLPRDALIDLTVNIRSAHIVP